MRARLLLLTVLLVAPGLCAPPRSAVTSATKAHPAIAITNVNLVDVTTGAILPRYTVVVRDGAIVGIARVGLLNLSANLRVVNGTGKYLIPGLWDMHVHLTGVEKRAWTEDVILPLYLANGIVGVRDMGSDFSLVQGWRQRVESGEIPGPHIVTPGPFLDARSDNPLTAVAVPDAATGRQMVNQLKQRGVDFIKVLSPPREAYFAILDEAHKQGMQVAGHVPEGVSAEEASEAGQFSIEHLSGVLMGASSKEKELSAARAKALAAHDAAALQKVRQETYDSFSLPKLRGLLREFREHRTWQTPTLVWTQTMSELAQRAAHDDRLKQMPAWVRADWDPAKLLPQMVVGDAGTAQLNRLVAARYQAIVAEMGAAKVGLLAGSDSPDPYVFPGSSLHEELELMVKAGLNPLEALQAATLRPAEFLGEQGRARSFAMGQEGDLLLLDANPLDDIRNTRKIFAVIMHGRYYSRQDLDRLLAKAAEAADKQN